MRESAEWRTLLLVAMLYSVWIAITFAVPGLPVWFRVILLMPVIAFHSSIQHECMHGHPFRNQHLNDALAWLPIGLLVPYARYKASHLKHHINENIADPYDDPESWYLDRDIWARQPAFLKFLLQLNNTLAGRILLGPAIGNVGFLVSEWHKIRRGDMKIAGQWLAHLVVVSVLVTVIMRYSAMPLWAYVLACYGGTGLLMIRTYLEHQAHERAGHRSVIIEDRGLFSLLFLNNNLHSVHHAYPSIAWYRLPAFFADNRDRFLKMNGDYRYESYLSVFRRFIFRAKEPVAFPLERRPDRRP